MTEGRSRLQEQTEVLLPGLCSADSQDAPQVGITAILARTFSGLKRSITGPLPRDQRTGVRAWCSSKVLKKQGNKTTATLSNLNQKVLDEALIV